MNLPTTRRLAAAGMTTASLLAIAGFTALGSVFDYPKILKEPATEILTSFRENQTAVMGWFLVLIISAALLAPVGVLLGRIAGATLGRWIAGIGIAAATVQVIGLSRWVLFVPHVSDDTFAILHLWLGKVLGETIGYALTATFTILVVKGVTNVIAPRWMSYFGYASAALIATGVIVPLVGAASISNFAGYVLWCVWLIAMSAVLWRTSTAPASAVNLTPLTSRFPAA